MKTLTSKLLTLIFISQAYFSFSQNWPKYYGETNRHDYSYDIFESYDKGYLICGGYFNNQSTWSWLIKTDINGDTLYEKILECNGFNYLRAIHQSTDGGILACGAIKYPNYSTMPYIIKLDACGDKIWCKSFYTTEELPWAQDIIETETGDIIVLVNQFGDYPEETMHLFKLNANGDVIWKKPFCSGYIHPEGALPLGKKVIITSNNNYLIAGEVYWEDLWNPGGPKPIRSLFVMVDSLGNEDWVLPFGLQDSIHGQGKNIIELNNNRYIGVANKWPIETMQSVFIEFDSLGNVLQYIIPDNEELDANITRGVPLDLDIVDSVYSLGGIYGNSEGGFSTEILLDTSIFTNFICYNHIQHINEEEPYSMITSFNKKIISNSTFKETGNWDISLSKLNLNLEYDTLDPGNYTYDSLCTTPGLPQSGFIYLDDCDIVTDVPSPEEYYAFLKTIPIKAYPNPATQGTITFEYENTEYHNNIELRCFDIYGKEVYKEKVCRYQGKSIVSIGSWGKGMYVAVVYSNGLVVGRCKFALLR